MARDTSAYPPGYLSVTEVLKLAGLSSLDAVPEQVLEHARQRGQDLHEWIDALNKGLLDGTETPPQQIAGRFRAYLKFREDVGLEVIAGEQVVRNDALRVCGTLDLLVKMERAKTRGLVVLDLKGTADLYPDVAIQLAGYASCFDQRPARAAVRLLPDGTYRLQTYTDRSDFNTWVAAAHIAHWRIAHGLAKPPER